LRKRLRILLRLSEIGDGALLEAVLFRKVIDESSIPIRDWPRRGGLLLFEASSGCRSAVRCYS